MFLDCGGYVYLKENDLVLEWEKVVFIMLLNYLGLIGLGKICRWVVMVIYFCIIYLKMIICFLLWLLCKKDNIYIVYFILGLNIYFCCDKLIMLNYK